MERLLGELTQIVDPQNPSHEYFYEYNANESTTPETSLFHCLGIAWRQGLIFQGAWRVSSLFHDALWNPAFCMAAYQLLGEQSVRFYHDQLFCKPAGNGAVGKFKSLPKL